MIERGGQLSARFSSWLGSGTGQTVAAVLATAIAALIVWALLRRLLAERAVEREDARPRTAAGDARPPLPVLAERERRRA